MKCHEMPRFGPTPLEPGTSVWVVDKDGGQVWTKAEVLALDGNNVQAAQCRLKNSERAR